jgi:hypothetical protein
MITADSILNSIANICVTVAIGVIAFFLRRSFTQIDNKADAKDCEQCQKDILALRADITTIKQDYITKEDFFREQAKTDKKLDRIMDILLEFKGSGNGIAR